MLYTYEERAKKLADIKVNNIKQAQKIAPAVIEVLEKYKGKSITGNKKRIKEAIESIDKALYVVIEHDMFEHVNFEVIYRGERRIIENNTAYYIDGTINIVNCIYTKHNEITQEMIDSIKTNMESEQARISLVKKTARDCVKIAKKKEDLIQQLNNLVSGKNIDVEIAEIAGIKSQYYM